MTPLKLLLLAMLIACSKPIFAQCNHTLQINDFSATCNGNGSTTATINVTILFGSGNNSATIHYDLGSGPVDAAVIEDNSGNIINQDIVFTVPTCNEFPVTLTAWPNPSGGGSACSSPAPLTVSLVLPVTFGEVKAERLNENIKIYWETYQEINNDFFEIERSKDNRSFTSIGRIEGGGTQSTLQEYTYIDCHPDHGRNYYRIKQVDFDGSYDYSEIVTAENEVSIVSVYPNPTVETLNLMAAEGSYFFITDDRGNKLSEIISRSTTTAIDVSRFLSGVYYLFDASRRVVTKFVKM